MEIKPSFEKKIKIHTIKQQVTLVAFARSSEHTYEKVCFRGKLLQIIG
jgi:hypothetical protein